MHLFPPVTIYLYTFLRCYDLALALHARRPQWPLVVLVRGSTTLREGEPLPDFILRAGVHVVVRMESGNYLDVNGPLATPLLDGWEMLPVDVDRKSLVRALHEGGSLPAKHQLADAYEVADRLLAALPTQALTPR